MEANGVVRWYIITCYRTDISYLVRNEMDIVFAIIALLCTVACAGMYFIIQGLKWLGFVSHKLLLDTAKLHNFVGEYFTSSQATIKFVCALKIYLCRS